MLPARPELPAVNPPGRVALVGAGAFGRFCAQAYARSPDLQLLAVADPDPAALDGIAGVRQERDWRALLTDPQVEVLHLASPPFVRREVACAALDAGKSVFCEKPLALTLAEADAMIALAAERRLALGIDYVMRHQPAYRLLEDLAVSGLLGRLRTVSFQNFAQAVPPGHWFWDERRSGGILVEHGVHFFDAFARIAGPPVRVHGQQPRREVVDVTVEYQSGALARFYHEFAFPGEVEWAEGVVMFERGRVEIEGWIPTSLRAVILAPPEAVAAVCPALGPELSAGSDGPTSLRLGFPDRQENYASAVVAGMRDVVLSHRDPAHRMLVGVEEARASLALALAARQAATSGQSVDL